jgi:hypothetical protein
MGKLVAQAGVKSKHILDYYADNGEAFLADKNLNPESGEAIIRNSPIEYYLVLCHGTFLLSDSTVCCTKYNGRKHHIIETCFYGTTVRYRNGRIV